MKTTPTLCPICATELTGKQRTTCSAPRCRVALHRRRNKSGDTSDAPLVAVARRVLGPTLKAKQLAARRKLKVGHKRRREEMRDMYVAETRAMKLEIQFSNARIAAEHERQIQAADQRTLSTMIARRDSQTMHPHEKDQWRKRNLSREPR